MPAQQPFTTLCQAACRPRSSGRADLHVHTTHSDGIYTPAEVVALACRAGLAALAVTDHDTLAGIGPARAAAAGTGLEIIAGVEISAVYQGRELHLLAYFVDPAHQGLEAALGQLRKDRERRFWDMADRLRDCGAVLDENRLRTLAAAGALGRRHLALLLVEARQVGSVREAFFRYLHDQGRAAVPKLPLPATDALALVAAAGGLTSWAHPGSACTRESLGELCGQGLGAVEVEYPGRRPGRRRQLRQWAAELGLTVSGGSDCHGPGDYRRDVGACGISGAELEVLRERCGARP